MSVKTKSDTVVIEENRGSKWINLVLQHRQKIFYGFLALICLLAVTYRLASGRHVASQTDYAGAEVSAMQLARGDADTGEALARLAALVDKHQELHSKYDGQLAQTLLKNSDVSLAQVYGDKVIARTSGDVPDYAEFAATTLLISKGNYVTALNRARALQEKLSVIPDSSPHGHLLRGHNLVRIAMLEQKVGTEESEARAWEGVLNELQSASSLNRQKARDNLLGAFRSGQVTLVDYAKYRLSKIVQ